MRLFYLLCLGGSIAFGSSPALAEGKTKAVINEGQVSGWVQLWQKRLHLDDWKVDVRIVRTAELRPDTLGNLKWNSRSRTASIRVLNPLDYDIAAEDVPEDIEYTVVHELIHLQLSSLPRDLNRKDIEEQVVNRITDALMLLERGDSFHARSQPAATHQGRIAGRSASDNAGRQAGL